MFSVQELMGSSGDLSDSYSEISKQSREKSRIELLEMLSKAEDDVENKRVEPIEHTFHNLRQRLREK